MFSILCKPQLHDYWKPPPMPRYHPVYLAPHTNSLVPYLSHRSTTRVPIMSSPSVPDLPVLHTSVEDPFHQTLASIFPPPRSVPQPFCPGLPKAPPRATCSSCGAPGAAGDPWAPYEPIRGVALTSFLIPNPPPKQMTLLSPLIPR